jgi:hypothetical protein
MLPSLILVETRPRPANPRRWLVLRQFRQTGCRRHRRVAAITRSESLRRCDQTPAAFVEKRRYRKEPLSDGFNIDHHRNIWYDSKVINQYFTLSKVDSIIS